ncbi:MAG: hypothetical protein HY094_00425 [Candidatus Melainabacteria bacterium]|nr:hypothetical protein [Candidatus Melainabacteria bacterium]
MSYLSIKELFNKLKPVDFYKYYYPDIKEGQNLVNCPFHDDKHPSMSIKTTPGNKGIFYCHACSAGGRFIDFYQKKHNVDFKTTLKEINEKFNLNLKPQERKRKGKEKKEGEEWKVESLRLNPIDLNSEIIKKYFESKNIPKPQELIEYFDLKCCKNNKALAISVGNRWKLKAFDDRGDRWDIDSDAEIEPIYYSLSPYTGQKNLLVIEGFSNLFSLWCYADEKFKKDFFAVTSVHGVTSTPNVIEKLIKEDK